jgi:hypothetical protein
MNPSSMEGIDFHLILRQGFGNWVVRAAYSRGALACAGRSLLDPSWPREEVTERCCANYGRSVIEPELPVTADALRRAHRAKPLTLDVKTLRRPTERGRLWFRIMAVRGRMLRRIMLFDLESFTRAQRLRSARVWACALLRGRVPGRLAKLARYSPNWENRERGR